MSWPEAVRDEVAAIFAALAPTAQQVLEGALRFLAERSAAGAARRAAHVAKRALERRLARRRAIPVATLPSRRCAWAEGCRAWCRQDRAWCASHCRKIGVQL